MITLIALLGVASNLGIAVARERGPTLPFCGSEMRPIDTPAGDLCTHGADELNTVASWEASSDGELQVPPAPCEGDGVTGPRVHVLYGHPSDRSDRYLDQMFVVLEAVARADAYLDASTPMAGGQHIRWACSGGAVSVTNIDLLPIGDDGVFTFDDTVTSLQQQVELGLGPSNYDTYGHVYLVFVDQVADVYGTGGQASLWNDDSPDATNRNNLGRSYSMVATFDGQLVLHELMHNLGAVQLSAPHTSGGYHCYESNDVMCYADTGSFFTNGGTLIPTCPDAPTSLVDCGGDDYYNLTAPDGTYLSDHWNVANSGFLTPAEPVAEGEPVAVDENPLITEPTPIEPAPTEPTSTDTGRTCTIRGTSGADVLRGTSGGDVICAGGGSDVIRSVGGRDVIYGGSGRDVVYGGTGADSLYGRMGSDQLFGGDGRDLVAGGLHFDICRSGTRVNCEG